MAESKKTTADKTKSEELVRFKLPRNPDPRASQDEFYSLNFHNYLIKRGEWVDLPRPLYEMIKEQEEAVEYAQNYSDELANRETSL